MYRRCSSRPYIAAEDSSIGRRYRYRRATDNLLEDASRRDSLHRLVQPEAWGHALLQALHVRVGAEELQAGLPRRRAGGGSSGGKGLWELLNQVMQHQLRQRSANHCHTARLEEVQAAAARGLSSHKVKGLVSRASKSGSTR